MRHDYQKMIEESASELHEQEKRYRNSGIGNRIRMLRLLKTGEAKSLTEAAALLGYSFRQVNRWLSSYRQGGLALLLNTPRKRGGKPELMTQEAWAALDAALKKDEIKSYREAREFLAGHDVVYADESGIFRLFRRHKIKAKTGRTRHEKSDEAVQEDFKKTLLGS